MAEIIRVYLAGPYSVGNKEANIVKALVYAEHLTRKGFLVYVPHLSHFWDLEYPHDAKFWLEYDEHWLAVCDCVLRIPGESVGADREMKFAINRGIPVCLDFESLEKWRKEIKGAPASG
jgi:nucleoside 2-deoxyribosyltransferase